MMLAYFLLKLKIKYGGYCVFITKLTHKYINMYNVFKNSLLHTFHVTLMLCEDMASRVTS